MRPVRRTEAHLGAGLAELVCSNSFRSDDAERNAVGLLHEEMRRVRVADPGRRRPAQGAGGRRARGRSGRVFRGGRGGAGSRSAGRDPPRGDCRAAAAGMGRGHHRDRPADLAVARRGAGGADRRGEPRLLRRDRADRLPRHDRFRRGVVPVALRQGRGEPTTSTARSTASSTRRSSRRCWPARRPSSTNGRNRRRISTAACRSRSWRRAVRTRCAGGR